MQNENKHRHWKEKLTDATAFSAETEINKEVGWEKLNHRLQQRSKRRKALLYWVSAACLLPLCLAVSFYFYQHDDPVSQPLVRTPVGPKPASMHSEQRQDEVVIVKPKEPVIRTNIRTKRKEETNIGATKKEKLLPDESNDPVAQPEEITTAIGDKTDTAQIAEVVQPKKKLRVVHINELNEPQVVTPVMARNFLPRFFPLHIASLEVETTSLQTIHRTSFISLKTKPSSN